MTITEFLLARIAEDEAVAEDAGEEWRRIDWLPGRAPKEELRSRAWADVDAQLPHVALAHTRGLAECMAKRAIVEDLGPELGRGYATSELAERTLRRLAAPYASHPDYRQEWRL